MSAKPLPHHISKQFEYELGEIRARVLEMGGLVETQLGLTLDALAVGSIEQAEVVATSDYKVNAMEVAIDEECIEILARRQPAAGDLRLVIAVTRIITDLERIGDETEKIARMMLRFMENGSPKAYYIGFLTMGRHVQKMVNGALNAFARMDSEAAMTVAQEEPKVDQEYNAVLRQLVTYMMEDPRSITRVLNAIWAVRALERIGDHANNICETAVYLVEGKDIRHTRIADVGEKVVQAHPPSAQIFPEDSELSPSSLPSASRSMPMRLPEPTYKKP